MTSTGRPVKIWCGEMLIRTVNMFSLSLRPSASDSPVNTKSESQIPLSSWTEHQPRTVRPVMDASSSNSSEWNNDDKWSSQVRRTGVHPILLCGETCKMCTDNFFNDEINNFFMDNYCSKIWNYVKLIRKVSVKWEELKKFQSSTFDTIARRRLVEDQDTILELTGKI